MLSDHCEDFHDLVSPTFVIDFSVAVHVDFSDDLVDVVVRQLFPDAAHHLFEFCGANLSRPVFVHHGEGLPDLVGVVCRHKLVHHRHELVEVNEAAACKNNCTNVQE